MAVLAAEFGYFPYELDVSHGPISIATLPNLDLAEDENRRVDSLDHLPWACGELIRNLLLQATSGLSDLGRRETVGE